MYIYINIYINIIHFIFTDQVNIFMWLTYKIMQSKIYVWSLFLSLNKTFQLYNSLMSWQCSKVI